MTKNELIQVRVTEEQKRVYERAVPIMRERTGDQSIKNVASMVRYLLENSPSVKEARGEASGGEEAAGGGEGTSGDRVPGVRGDHGVRSAVVPEVSQGEDDPVQQQGESRASALARAAGLPDTLGGRG